MGVGVCAYVNVGIAGGGGGGETRMGTGHFYIFSTCTTTEQYCWVLQPSIPTLSAVDVVMSTVIVVQCRALLLS